MISLFLFSFLGFFSAEQHTFKTAEHHAYHAKGYVKNPLRHKLEAWKMPAITVAVPNRLDLRPLLSQIEDQGQCGSCWAFSLTANLVDGHRISDKDPGRLSQQYLVSCAKDSYGCDGGDFSSAKYFLSPKGSPSLVSYPYTATNGKCRTAKRPLSSIAKWGMLGQGSSPTQKEIIEYLVAYKHPLSVTVAAGSGKWEDYQSGIYNACTNGQVDHMINVVGYDCEADSCKFDKNGALPRGKGYWILRNSWGKSWGENGWMRMKMTDKKGNRCNAIAEEASYFLYK